MVNLPRPQAAVPLTADETTLWPIGALALLAVALLPGGPLAAVAVGLWGALALLAWIMGQEDAASLARRAVLPLLVYAVVAALALAGRIDLAGAALAPLAVLLLVALLPRPDTAPAAGDWGTSLVAVLWALAGTLGLAALLTIPAELGSAAVVMVALVFAYNVGRRAGRIQGQSGPVAIGIGAVLAVFGSIMLAGGLTAVQMVVGLIAGLASIAYAPAPPSAAALPWRSLAAVHHQLVFVTPLAFAILWVVQTFT